MSHTRVRRNRHPRKQSLNASRMRAQVALYGQTCDLCAAPLRRKPYFNDLYAVLCRACYVKEWSMPTTHTTTMTDLTAFCPTCPAAEEITALLASLGFTLVFQMQANTARSYTNMPPLPAQYHYEGPHGASVIYLDGKDIPSLGDEDERESGAFPPHASRFWLYAGTDASVHEHTAKVLTATWQLTWLPLEDVPVEQLSTVEAAA